jgi:hypothetical protein
LKCPFFCLSRTILISSKYYNRPNTLKFKKTDAINFILFVKYVAIFSKRKMSFFNKWFMFILYQIKPRYKQYNSFLSIC